MDGRKKEPEILPLYYYTSKYARALQREKESIKYLWETMTEMIYVYLYLIFLLKF
jgi:hypothetical protein